MARITPPTGSMFCQNWKSYSRQLVVRNKQVNLEATLNKGVGGAILTILVADCLQNLKRNEKCFLKNQNFRKNGIFKRELYRRVYQPTLELFGASISKNLTNKKQKNQLFILMLFGVELDMIFVAECMNQQYWGNSFLMFYKDRM